MRGGCDIAAPVIFSQFSLSAEDVAALMDELIEWWPDRPLPTEGGVGKAGGMSHLRWVRDTFRAAEVVDRKPDEPTGLGAVVEDAHGTRWMRVCEHLDCNAWNLIDDGIDGAATGLKDARRYYRDIAAVKVLSSGVTA